MEVEKDQNSGKRPRATLAGGSAAAAAWRSCRVARAAAGCKDRHSKVVTARGLRDRRVRLSVPTAIQFYDLQDRLGVDQPSKAIEWLIRGAAAAIDALPSLDCSFPLPSPVPADDEGNADDTEASTSDASKSSVLSLANGIDNANANATAQHTNAGAGVGSQVHSTFVELLNCSAADKPMQPPPLAYYAAQSSHIAPMSFEMVSQLAFSQEPHLATVAFDRGTLQSNAAATPLWPPSHHPCLMQRFAAPMDAPGMPFFRGGSGGGGGGAAPGI